jgi:steroid delta-isomerase-like uncharacterized protein
VTLTREQMRATILEHVDAENANDPARVVATYSDTDPVFEDVPTGAHYVGGDEIVGNYRHLWDGFPGLSREITRWTFGDNAVVIELVLRGKHEGPFRGIPTTGREIAHRVIAHFEFDGEGRIRQETAYYDTLTFRRQLGVTTGNARPTPA